MCTSIAKRIIAQKKFYNAACEYGKKNENVALESYKKIKNALLLKCGLYIDDEFNFIAASPDAIYSDRSKIVEVKCPTSNLPLDMPYLIYNNEKNCKTLDKTHKYFLQCQLEMRTTKTNKCDFVVWSPTQIYIEEIIYEKDWLYHEILMMKQYYEKVFCYEYIKYMK